MIKRMVILLLLAWTSSLAWCDEVLLSTDSIDAAKNDSIAMQFRMISRQLDSIAMKINACDALDRAAIQIDSLDAKERWKHVVLRHGWSINDTAIYYPPVLNFGVKAYRWLNHALNYYDSAYVVNPGKGKKKFKVMIKNSNWIDFYSGHLGKWETPVQLNSDVTSLFGFHISGMGLSFTYMLNARDLLAGRFIHNRRLQFSFTTSRIFIEGYYRKNDRVQSTCIGWVSGRVTISSTVSLARVMAWMHTISLTTPITPRLRPTVSPSIKSAAQALCWRVSTSVIKM